MPEVNALKLDAALNRLLAARVREELARRRLSREALADKARISLSTLEKALSGKRPFTLATLVRVEEALGLSLRPAAEVASSQPATGGDVAPDELGSYSRPAVAWLEGAYVTLRPSFSAPAAIYAYRTTIAWDERSARLTFHEAERVDTDFTQFGSVSVPHQSGHIYLVTNRHGQHRLIVVTRPVITGEMHGVLTTLMAGRGAHLSPVATPIVFVRLKPGETPAFGVIASGHAAYAGYRKHLKRAVADGFATFLPG